MARTTVPTPARGTRDTIMHFLHQQIDRVTGGRPPTAIGVGASGPIDAAGVIRNPDTLPAFSDLPVKELLRQFTSGPVVIENDAVCAALAERRTGAARDAPRSLHVTLGTGIGVCLLDGDEPLRRGDGTHPEGGHISVGQPTAPCYCGRRACWEQAASRQALQRSAATLLGRPWDDVDVIAEIAARAGRGDPDAQNVFDGYGRGLADGLGTLLTLYDPALVVIGGSAAQHLARYRRSAETALAELGGWIPSYRIVATRLDDYGGALGGVQLVARSTTADGDLRDAGDGS